MSVIDKVEGFYQVIDKSIGVFKHKFGDAGYDLYTTKDMWVWPFKVIKIPLNCKIEIPDGTFGLITSRSGMSLAGLFTIPGIVDCIYRGQVSAIMFRFGLFPKKVKKGTRLCQLIVVPYKEMSWKEKEIVPDTARGENAFGDSGAN